MKYFSVLIALILASCVEIKKSKEYTTWETYLGDQARTHYSSLDQINKSNVQQLQVAWTYHTGDSDENSYIQCNPIIIDDVLYSTSPKLKVFALNAETGEELWSYDPFAGTDQTDFTRGLFYHENKIYFTAGKYLHCLNATDGVLNSDFGESGLLDLTKGLDRDITGLSYSYHAPATRYKDLLIMGSITAETLPAAPGHIRAFDINTGEQKWIFHTIPHPGEFGYQTWEDSTAYQFIGGANNWTGLTVDEDRGIVFVPTGSASYDFYGANRKGSNLFANSLVALDAETGERIWHYQAVKHDIWDRDFPSPPTLVTVKKDGRSVDAVSVISKTGHIYVFDRETGESLFPIHERSYPSSELPGEETWPTQSLPISPPPFSRQHFTIDDINPYSNHKDSLVERFKSYRNGHFEPPSTEGTILFPGMDGGGEWGGTGYDPTTGVLYVNANNIPWIIEMIEVEPSNPSDETLSGLSLYQQNCMSCHGANFEGSTFHGNAPELLNVTNRMTLEEITNIILNGRGTMPAFKFIGEEKATILSQFLNEPKSLNSIKSTSKSKDAVEYKMKGYQRFLDADGYPAISPPWGTLSAIDLNKAEIRWTIPLGEHEELTKKGIPVSGTENYGGPVVTAGGLIFIGATEDGYFRAFDKGTGEELWKYRLPAPGQATPATYEINGTQYVVIAAAGGKGTDEKSDTYIAFKLQE